MGQLVVILMYHLRMVGGKALLAGNILHEGSRCRQNTLFTQGADLTHISSFVPSHIVAPTNARNVHSCSILYLFVARLDVIFVSMHYIHYGIYFMLLGILFIILDLCFNAGRDAHNSNHDRNKCDEFLIH